MHFGNGVDRIGLKMQMCGLILIIVLRFPPSVLYPDGLYGSDLYVSLWLSVFGVQVEVWGMCGCLRVKGRRREKHCFVGLVRERKALRGRTLMQHLGIRVGWDDGVA